MLAASLIGFTKSGKTTLTGLLAGLFEERGLRVAIAKHTHHGLDKPDTDTTRLMAPGRQVLGFGPDETMVFWGKGRHLADLLPLVDADVLLVEGGKSLGWLPRVLCLRSADEAEALGAGLALACFGDVGLPDRPLFNRTTLPALADLILAQGCTLPGLDCGACGETSCAQLMERIVRGDASIQSCRALPASLSVRVNGQPVGLNPFTAAMLHGGISGMLRALKGVAPGKVDISLDL